jgi:hypothetical protein
VDDLAGICRDAAVREIQSLLPELEGEDSSAIEALTVLGAVRSVTE